ncbi:MAG TPA: double-strand break repair helicase AddA, partial [Pseudolabrys sp.]|nr:double-strand break repair helicase AddA [Pseudolabrys sp.]
MKNVGARDTGEKIRARARRLFALALETPGGLKVQTIHAFCTHILHLFPFEANVAARFSVLDEAQEDQLLERTTNEVLLDAAAAPQSETGRALRYAIGAVADGTFRNLIGDAIEKRDAVEAWLTAAGSVKGAAKELSHAIGIDPADNEEIVAAEFFGKSLVAQSEWSTIASIAATGKETDRQQAERFTSLPTLFGLHQIERYIEIFCTKTSGPRKNVFTIDIRKSHVSLCERLHEERDRVWALIERRRAIAARERTIALITVAKAVLDRFNAEKDRRGLLDFEDQIDKTHDLLARVSAAWVHYKLDKGIEHVLIDEAQDTSPKQWSIIRHLVAEFFAGKGASEKKRTIFAVGDEKQSIFSFQGAAPAEFESMRHEFEKLSGRSEQPFHHVRFDTSLRSGENVLSAVDIVFKPEEVAKSLTHDIAGIPEHIALASAAPGEVEIWDTEKPLDEIGEKDPWNAPFDTLSGTKPVVRLAERIAKSVQALIAAGGRPGGVLVLVNRRGALFEAIIRALKNARIPVAGADRLVLTEHIAVMDLLVLADALLLPHDDLALATVLKSPLFGFDDDDIFELAYERGTKPLSRALRQKAAGNAKFAAALARLDALTTRARNTKPFDFYAHLLGAERGRERFMARLGHEATDALDELLNLALDYERSETPSLQGFVDWLRAAKSEVKRDMETARDEVRVMTVHGAKGLEAPVVYLADTTTRPEGHHPPPLLALPAQSGAAPLIWVKSEKEDIGPMGRAREAARAETRNEHRRLLYVAMTRAAERLIVCGIESKKRPDNCWYDLVLNGLQGQPGFSEHEQDGGKLWRYRKIESSATALPLQRESAPPIDKPAWLQRTAAAEAPVFRIITPSTAGQGDKPSIRPETPDVARTRGQILHRLMQSLPDIPPGRRKKAADDFIRRATAAMDEDERQSLAALAGQAMAVLVEERFSALFAPGSRAEVPIVGDLPQGRVSGQIDRLAVTQEAVWIGDFKSGKRPAETPPSYITQLALYRAVLAKLYPDLPVCAALIWTEGPDLMEVPAPTLDGALAGVTSL